MINIRYFSSIYLCSFLLLSCNKSFIDDGSGYVMDGDNKTHISIMSTYSSESSSNQIERVSIYSFAQKPGDSNFTFETKIQNLLPSSNDDTHQISLTLDGSLPRLLYTVANENTSISYPHLTSKTTSEQFEQNSYVTTKERLSSPYLLVAKSALLKPQYNNVIAAEFTHTAACIGINNRFTGFVIDSLVVKNTMNGTYLFVNSTTNDLFSTININYENNTELYIYPTENSFIAVYGKYNNVRTVFDVPLINIKAATRYRVTFKGINDQTLDFSSNLIWNVEAWNAGNSVDSNPDWTNNLN